MIFRDRTEGGQLLATELEGFAFLKPIVLALPRGGVPVAAEVAARLDAPLDVLLVRKIGAPSQPEFAIGAVAENSKPIVNRDVVAGLDITPADLRGLVAKELKEIQRQSKMFRDDRPMINVAGRVVILIDDGLATGATARAAIRSLKTRGATEIILGVPVGAREAAIELRNEADQVFVLKEPPEFRAVGLWYHDFRAVTDQEVKDLLEKNRQHHSAGAMRHENVVIGEGKVKLIGDLTLPKQAKGLILFA
ncbi:MAG: phosphoribosyltransferase, partial [Bdellovibrionia bacterium]